MSDTKLLHRNRPTTPAGTKVMSSKNKMINKVQQTCPSYHNSHIPTNEDVQRLRSLTLPHVESFNYFLEYGLSAGIQSIEPMELDIIDPSIVQQQQQQAITTNSLDYLEDVSTIQFWIEDVTIAKPLKSFTSRGVVTNFNSDGNLRSLYPREARERGCMYSGTITGTFCYRILERRNDIIIPNNIVRISNKTFGDMPIMVLSKACHLHNTTPKQLVQLKEEV
jgi:DNA-directed RNA polymerase I subunit RPA2